MNCFVCGGVMAPYFTKTAPDGDIWRYLRCPDCGLVINKYTYDATPEQWEKINYVNHSAYQGTGYADGDPRWILRLRTQADVLAGLFRDGVFEPGMRIVDYGCGDGKLADYISDTGGVYLAR